MVLGPNPNHPDPNPNPNADPFTLTLPLITLALTLPLPLHQGMSVCGGRGAAVVFDSDGRLSLFDVESEVRTRVKGVGEVRARVAFR